MKAIGVRELRQQASEYLRQVENGETIEVTAHGRPVARLVPIRSSSGRQRLVAHGRIVPGAGDLLDLGRPLPRARRIAAPSALLQRARARER